MDLKAYYRTYSSDSSAGTANQVLTADPEPVERTGRVWFRLEHGGENYYLLFSNRIDSTFADGSISRANDIGGDWDILSLRVGQSDKRGEEPASVLPVAFDRQRGRRVSAGDPEPFFTDPIPLHAKGGEWLWYEITVRGARYPYHEEMVLTAEVRDGEGWREDKRIPVPLMIGSDRPVSLRLGFLGDSITQGCGTVYNSYTHWAAKIAEGLPDEISVWDLGIGYARAYDAASDGGWLARAKECGVVNVCLGVNDLVRGRCDREILADLTAVVRALKAAGCRVVLFTVPPFDFTGKAEEYWYSINRAIRETLSKEADALFDFAAVLGRPAPEEHRSVWGGHPNAEGCRIAAEAYLKEYRAGRLPF